MLEIFVALLLYSFVFVIVYVLCFEKKDKNAHSYMYFPPTFYNSSIFIWKFGNVMYTNLEFKTIKTNIILY